MTQRTQVYKCGLCGNIVSVVHQSGGTLSCCGQDMDLLVANTTDAAQEKHVPVLERTPTGWSVSVGSVEHPMADDHYIEWIELLVGDQSLYAFLKPGDKPFAEFCVDADSASTRAYCNLHGLWKS